MTDCISNVENNGFIGYKIVLFDHRSEFNPKINNYSSDFVTRFINGGLYIGQSDY